MKKLFALLLVLMMVLSLAACGANKDKESSSEPEKSSETESQSEEQSSEPESEESKDEEKPVMSHADYAAAAVDDPVVVETYVQAHQSWWDNKITVYAASEDGAYFIYELACSEEDAAKFVPGTKIRVEGFKGEWSGEVEIVDATFSFVDDGSSYIAEPVDVTDLLGKDELIDHQNEFVSFKGMTVEAKNDEGAAFLYKWDGSGSEGDDLYFDVSKDGTTYSFTVESYLCDKDSDVYKAVQGLKVGDVVDMEGFLYWYEGVNPHITSVTVTGSGEAAAAPMSHADYVAAAVDDPVVVETYVQAHQSWWDNKVTVYAASEDGAYFIYELACSEEDAEKLVPGTKIRVEGFKGEWSGEVEIVDATFSFVDDGTSYIAEHTDVTDLLGKDELIDHQNEFVFFKGMTVEAKNDEGAAFLYKWDGSGTEGDDLYFDVSVNGEKYTFTVESYLCDKDSDVYKAVQNLKVGDVIDMEGFLYWYEGVNPHITHVTVI